MSWYTKRHEPFLTSIPLSEQIRRCVHEEVKAQLAEKAGPVEAAVNKAMPDGGYITDLKDAIRIIAKAVDASNKTDRN